jgi:hypothetical protein
VNPSSFPFPTSYLLRQLQLLVTRHVFHRFWDSVTSRVVLAGFFFFFC